MRKGLNKILRGRLINIRGIFSEKVNDNLIYNLKTDIGYNLYYKGVFEKEELEICRKFIKEDSVILDIGANIGIHSIFFASLANQGTVFSLEPQKNILSTLIKNTKKFKNIVILNFAVSESLSISNFFIAQDDAYSSLKDTKRKNLLTTDKVLTIPLDLLIDVFTRIDLVKIDVEGFETEVIKSMSLIIDKFKPVIFVEIYKGENSNSNPEKVINFLLNKGYSAFVVKDYNLVPYIKHDDSFQNHFFIYE